jgi:hypothetical protein
MRMSFMMRSSKRGRSRSSISRLDAEEDIAPLDDDDDDHKEQQDKE